jgi:hypothetical protein
MAGMNRRFFSGTGLHLVIRALLQTTKTPRQMTGHLREAHNEVVLVEMQMSFRSAFSNTNIYICIL